MKVLVYPKNLEIGGSQVNAVNLAAAFRNRGHEVTLVAPPGPLSEVAIHKGLPWVPIHVPKRPRPSVMVVSTLREVVRRTGAELIHAYEVNPSLEAFYAGLISNVPVVASLMGSVLPPYFPEPLPVISNNPKFKQEAETRRVVPVHLVEARIDIEENHPDFDASDFRRQYALDEATLTVVIVSRLDFTFKLGGIKQAMAAVLELSSQLPVRLLIAGGGPALTHLKELADEVNHQAGRPIVIMTGQLVDPRPAYSVGDVIVGVGSSILRSMAFGKPSVLLGNEGFAACVTPANVDELLEFGFSDRFVPADRKGGTLARVLRHLLTDPSQREEYGTFLREVVQQRFSVTVGAASLEAIYRQALEHPTPFSVGLKSAALTTARLVATKLRGRFAAGGER